MTGLEGQLALTDESSSLARIPSTRYQGSKLKLLPWLGTHFLDLEFETALDAFGGTGSVAYLLKQFGKTVTYNDKLRFNFLIGRALIENNSTRLTHEDVEFLLHHDDSIRYDAFVERTFSSIFFTEQENRWIDVVVQNIDRLADEYKKALAYFALFQACVAKRPYNLFHRANLYMRLASVERSFGNKTTWDRAFEDHFRHFVHEGNSAVFQTDRQCLAMQCDAAEVVGDFDLVYIDPPYLSARGVGVDYLDFYHFLEGLSDYRNWRHRLNHQKKHLPLVAPRSPWTRPDEVELEFQRVINRFKDSTLVISYRNDGLPSPSTIARLLRRVKDKVHVREFASYKYVLAKRQRRTTELLFIAS